MVETNTAGNPFLTRAYAVGNANECKALYDEWAETYNKDLTDPSQDYVAPTLAAQAVLAAGGRVDGSVLDAGCGTGLCGIALSQAGAKKIDGIDLSPGMLKVAEQTGVYQSLKPGDLSKRIDRPSAAYDVVICVGTLTHGHVGPAPALKEFVRITVKRGVIVATVLDDIWSSGGYKAEVEKLKNEGLVEVTSTEKMEYRRGAGVEARMVVLKKK